MATKVNPSVAEFEAKPDEALTSVKTGAKILDVSEATIWRMVKAGKLTAKKVGERNTRLIVGEIRKLAAA
jgi:excisionase family DNA binding protein